MQAVAPTERSDSDTGFELVAVLGNECLNGHGWLPCKSRNNIVFAGKNSVLVVKGDGTEVLN
jgi:hypothetical protein